MLNAISRKFGRYFAFSRDAKVVRNAAGTLSLRILFVALELACTLAIARVFSASGFGVYAFVMSWVGLLGIPAALGFDRLLIRQIAAYRSRDAWGLVRGILRRSSQVVLSVSIGLAGLVAGIVPLFGSALDEQTVRAVQVGMLLLPLVAYARLRQAATQGLGHVAYGQIPETLVQPFALLCFVLALPLMPFANSGVTAVSLNVIAAALACYTGIHLLRRTLPRQVRAATPEFRTADWLRGAAPFMWMLGMNMVTTHAGTIIVGFFLGPTEAGIYRVASQMANLAVFPVTAINMAVAPTIASLYARGDAAGLQTTARDVTRASISVSLPIVVLLVICGRPLLGLFGTEFQAGYPALVILCIAYFVNAAAGAAGYLLIMTRYEKEAAITFTVAAAANVLGCLVLVPSMQINGAAIATSSSVAGLSVAFMLLSWRRLGIRFASGERR